MLDKLKEAIQKLPELLQDPNNFDSLIVNRRKPHTYRVFTHFNGYRICLHKFDVCDRHEAFLHPHPWPGAFAILLGSYEMEVGYSVSRTEKPNHVLKVVLLEGSRYEITSPLTWHSVTPLEPTYTVMVNGEPWDAETAHTDVRTTKGKDLDRMEPDKLLHHLKSFRLLLPLHVCPKCGEGDKA